MQRRVFCGVVALAPLVVASRAFAASARPLRVAWVSFGMADPNSVSLLMFRQGLRELGYSEGRHIVIETWWGEGSADKVEKLAADIVRSNPDIVVAGGPALRPLVKAGVKLPIVFTMSADPVEAKLVDSFARPGGNLTGMSLFTVDMIGKRMEFLKEVMPGVRRIAVIANPMHAGEKKELAAAQFAADRQGLAMRYLPTHTGAEVDRALAQVAQARDEAIVAFADAFTMSYAERIAEFSLQKRIPAVSGWAEFARKGNLLSYGPVVEENQRRLAVYVDKIHKGAKPGDLPIEFPTRTELVVNLKAAQGMGIAIPVSLLARADEVIR